MFTPALKHGTSCARQIGKVNIACANVYRMMRSWPCLSSSTKTRSDVSHVTAPEHEDCDVLIVGAGPVGLTLSLLLAKYGVKSTVVDKLNTPTCHPQAHFIHQRGMEVFRSIGVAKDIYAAVPPIEDWRKFLYCSTLAGVVYGAQDHFPGVTLNNQPDGADVGDSFSHHYGDTNSPCSVVHLAQDKLVRILLQHARAHPLIDVKFGHAVQSYSAQCILSSESQRQTNSTGGHREGSISVNRALCTTTTNLHPYPGNSGTTDVRITSDFLIGADGASSTVRKLAGVPVDFANEKPLQHLLNIHFIAPNLKPLLSDRGMLYFIYNKDIVAVVVAHDLDEGQYVLQVPYFPPYQEFSSFTPAMCTKLVEDCIGHKDVLFEIQSVKRWAMQVAQARHYQTQRTSSAAGRDNVFLVGDACHEFPPAGAFGIGTGVADASNLAWKLAWHLRCGDLCSDDLLATYELERRPAAEATARLSMTNYHDVLDTGAVLGADASHLEMVLGAAGGSWLTAVVPHDIRSTMVTSALALGRAQFKFLLTPQVNPIGRRRLARFTQHLSTKGLQLLYPEHDLGHIYPTPMQMAATIARHAPSSHDHTDSALKTAGTYVPRLVPGARLPHAEIAVAEKSKALLPHPAAEDVCSTIDLVNVLQPGELLLLVWGADGVALAEQRLGAVCAPDSPYQLVPVVLNGGALPNGMRSDRVVIQGTWCDRRPRSSWDGQDAPGAHPFLCSDGRVKRGTGGGALLARPDGYICWAEVHDSSTSNGFTICESHDNNRLASEHQLRVALRMLYQENSTERCSVD